MDLKDYLLKRQELENSCYTKSETMTDELTGEEITWYSLMNFELLNNKTYNLDMLLLEYIKGKYIKEFNVNNGTYTYYKIVGLCRDKSISASIYCIRMYKDFSSVSDKRRKPISKDMEIIDIDTVAEENDWRKPYDFKKTDRNLYILLNEHGRVKIGISIDLEQRIKVLEAASGCKISLLRLIENGSSLEKILHKHYKHKRYLGEWFNLDKEDIDFLLKTDLKSYFLVK